jgi:hypothetical protein
MPSPPAMSLNTSAAAATSPGARTDTRTAAARPSAAGPADKLVAPPFIFEARALLHDGEERNEVDCQVVLAGGTITVQAKNDHATLYAVPYDSVLSIRYSRRRRGVLGIHRTSHWVSLRTTAPSARMLALRLPNDDEAVRAITALERRTGRTAALVVEGKGDK